MTESSQGQVLWILGLLHSGTTIFWKSFRKDERFICFDEPFTGNLGCTFPKNNKKGTFDEFQRRFAGNPSEFWSLYEPIELWQEFDSEFSPKQKRYLQSLLDYGENIVIDETHLHMHLSELAQLTPNGRVIHLYRRASAFATSHLLPSEGVSKNLLHSSAISFRQRYRKHSFFSRELFLPGMRRGEVIGAHPWSKFGLLLAEAGYDAERIMYAPAVVRLLAYWLYHYRYLELEGPRVFGNQFASVSYERFADAPRETMFTFYDSIGMTPPSTVSYADVYRPKPPYRARDPHWRYAAHEAGFTDEEIERLL